MFLKTSGNKKDQTSQIPTEFRTLRKLSSEFSGGVVVALRLVIIYSVLLALDSAVLLFAGMLRLPAVVNPFLIELHMDSFVVLQKNLYADPVLAQLLADLAWIAFSIIFLGQSPANVALFRV